jgi:ABC-type multidrug transport system permease subunit
MIRWRSKFSRFTLTAVGIAVVAVIVLAIIGTETWSGIGDSEISPMGWVAMGIGIVVTLGLGIGLMALVFISSRRGYDEASRSESVKVVAMEGRTHKKY